MSYYYSENEAFVLSSSCPLSCSLVSFALRLGGVIDPTFLAQCRITDKKLDQQIKQLKQVPLSYDSSAANYDFHEELFLDMDAQNNNRFADPRQFNQYNAWLENQNDWNIDCSFNEDLVIDLI